MLKLQFNYRYKYSERPLSIERGQGRATTLHFVRLPSCIKINILIDDYGGMWHSWVTLTSIQHRGLRVQFSLRINIFLYRLCINVYICVIEYTKSLPYYKDVCLFVFLFVCSSAYYNWAKSLTNRTLPLILFLIKTPHKRSKAWTYLESCFCYL